MMMPAPRKEIRRFDCRDEAGNIHTVIEYEITIASREVRRDAQSSRGFSRTEFYLVDGSLLLKVDADTFKIGRGNKVIRKI